MPGNCTLRTPHSRGLGNTRRHKCLLLTPGMGNIIPSWPPQSVGLGCTIPREWNTIRWKSGPRLPRTWDHHAQGLTTKPTQTLHSRTQTNLRTNDFVRTYRHVHAYTNTSTHTNMPAFRHTRIHRAARSIIGYINCFHYSPGLVVLSNILLKIRLNRSANTRCPRLKCTVMLCSSQ